MVMVHAPNGKTTERTSGPVPGESSVPDTPAAIAEPAPGTPIPREPEASAAEDAVTAGQRTPRTFKFREDYVPAAEPATVKTPRGPRIPDPPKTAGPAVKAPPAVPDETLPTDAPSTSDSSGQARQWLLLCGAALTGIVLALLVVGFLASRLRTPPPSDEEVPAAEQDRVPAPTNRPSGQGSTSTPSADNAPAAKSPSGSGQTTAGDSTATPESSAPKEGTTGDAQPPVEAAKPSTVDDVKTNHDGTGPDVPPSNDPASADPNTGPAAELSLTISALALQDMPLVAFADFVADFTALPVSFDIDAMLVAQIALDTKLDLDRQQVTIGQVLQAVLEPVGLKYVVEGRQILIAPLRDVNQEMQQASYDVSDLASGDEQAQALAKLIVTLIAPGSWADTGGSGTLVVADQSLDIEQTAAGHFHVARFLDRLRSARGLLPRSKLPDDLLDLTPMFVRAGGDLNSPMSVNFSEPTDVARILQYLRAETDIRLIVDWPSTAQANWLPTTKSTLSGPDQPLSRLLDSWLDPVQLGYRVIDSKTIQITSLPTLENRPDVEIYPLKSDTDQNGTQLVQDLKVHMGPALFADAGGTGEIVFEPESRSLLVLLPQPQQRKVAEWLQKNAALRGP
jgi:hypothetical protein